MSLHTPTPSRQKPPRWAPMSAGLVAPEWQWVWRQLHYAYLIDEKGDTTLRNVARRDESITMAANPPTWQSGQRGAEIKFNGTNQDGQTNKAIGLSGNKLTIAVMVNMANATAADRVLIEHSANFNNVTNGFIIYGTSGGAMVAGVRGAGTYSTWSITQLAGCHLYLYTFDRSLATNITQGYLDGKLAGAALLNQNASGNFGSQITYVAARNSGSLFWEDAIVGIWIWERLLSVSEIGKFSNDPFAAFRMAEEEDYYVSVVGGLSIPVAMHHYKLMRRG